MKIRKFLLSLLLLFALIGCGEVRSITSTNTTTDNSTTTSSNLYGEYISFNDPGYQLKVGDEIPDWEDYFDILNPDLVEKYEVNSDFEFMDFFEEPGEFTVQVKLTLKNGIKIYESFTVNVESNPDLIGLDYLEAIFLSYMSASSFNYHSMTAVTFADQELRETMNLDYTTNSYINEITFDNLFHTKSVYELENDDEFHYVEETYMTLDDQAINVTYWNDETEKWSLDVFSYEQFMDIDNGFEYFDLSYLTYGLDRVETEINDDYLYVTIPISESNFSVNMFPEIYQTLLFFGMIDLDNDASIVELIEDKYSLIDFELKFDRYSKGLISMSIKFGYFLESIARDMDFELPIGQTNYFYDASTTIEYISTRKVSLVVPEVTIDYAKAGYLNIASDQQIRDAYVDELTHSIYYSIEGDNFLHKFDYISYEQSLLYFDIIPDQITARDELLYVTLSDGHFYYNDEQEYGGLAVINMEDFTIVNEFDLDFDPFDIVVDKNEYAYITHGSNQHGSLRSINTKTGLVVSSNWGFYYLGNVLYSDFTEHLYYVELTTTYNNLDIYDVQFGNIISTDVGDRDFKESFLTMSPDGRYIYARDGNIFILNELMVLDGVKFDNVGFSFKGIAFDQENDITYFARENGIYKMDEDLNTLDIYKYSFDANKLYFADNRLFCISNNLIEIIDLEKSDDTQDTALKLLNYGDEFIIRLLLRDYGYYDYEPSLISGSLDEFTIGQYELMYSLDNGEEIIELSVLVVVMDMVGPEIALPPNEEREIELGTDFTAAECIVTDNYDQNPTCVVLENNIDTSVLGMQSITYLATDSSGNRSSKTFYYNVILPTVEYDLESIVITDNVSEAVFSEEEFAIFYISSTNHEVVKYNILTSTEERLAFDFLPEHIVIYEGKLFVTLIHQAHSSYWWEENQTGDIAIIDMATFEIDSINRVAVDPYSIAIIDDYIYIAPGSGQWVEMFAYSINDFSNRITVCGVRQQMTLAFIPGSNYFFGISNDTSPQFLERYETDFGTMLSVVEDPGHGDYSYGTEIFVSANSDFVFNSYGQAFYQEGIINQTLLNFAFDLKFNLSAYAYDSNSNRSLYGSNEGYVKVSGENEYSADYAIDVEYPVDELYGTVSEFYFITYTSTGMIFTTASITE